MFAGIEASPAVAAVFDKHVGTAVVVEEESVVPVVDKIDSGGNTTGYTVGQSLIGCRTVDNYRSFIPLSLNHIVSNMSLYKIDEFL